jgi:hypothetical protein
VIIGSLYKEPRAVSLLDGVGPPLQPMVSRAARAQSERAWLPRCECEGAVRDHRLINPFSVSFLSVICHSAGLFSETRGSRSPSLLMAPEVILLSPLKCN